MNTNYSLIHEITNSASLSHVPEVDFHPSGDFFVVSYRDNNRLNVYDTKTYSLIRSYQNPSACLSYPHAVNVTQNHIIISNKHNAVPNQPASINVYSIHSKSSKPVFTMTTPMPHLSEAHSMATHNNKLLVTYCGENSSAVVTYEFDDDIGKITKPLSILEDWFIHNGEPKGISFNEDHTKVFISVTKVERPPQKVLLKKIKNFLTEISACLSGTRRNFSGIAVFDIDQEGVLSEQPISQTRDHDLLSSREENTVPTVSRIENIKIAKHQCVMSDSINNKVYIHPIVNNSELNINTTQTLSDAMQLPHGVAFSPDSKLLVVTNYGLKTEQGRVLWTQFTQPRSDSILIYSTQETPL